MPDAPVPPTPGSLTPRLGAGGLPLYVRDVSARSHEELARTEWLLTAGDGGFAMGTVLGVPARRYHGLLVASMRPPVERVMTLHSVAESLLISPDTLAEERVDLSTFRFRPGELHPRGDAHLVRFEKDTSVRWTWKYKSAVVTKEVLLVRGAGAVMVRYTVSGESRPTRLMLRPLVAMRDFHALTLRDVVRDRFSVKHAERSLVVQSPLPPLHIGVDHGQVAPVEQWWYNFQYDLERDRGYDYLEDLYHPGSFVVDFPGGGDGKQGGGQSSVGRVTLWASLGSALERDFDHERGVAAERAGAILERARASIGGVGPHHDAFSVLALAGDDFVVKRSALPGAPAPKPARAGQAAKPEEPATIIAGYPWFVDWGRDSMIALPGLLLVTGRFDEARRLLATFAAHTMDGLVPNVFDDYTGQPHYNTVDASLWFIHACTEFFRATGDTTTFIRDLLPACLAIVRAYREGTHFNIRMDPADGLIAGGDPSTQLTWMDAKRDGVVFTPRHGKAVEINALWYHALAALLEAAGPERPALRGDLGTLLERVGKGFLEMFAAPGRAGLIDCASPEIGQGHVRWRRHEEVRPNQVFAAALRHSPLSVEQRRSVVEVVKARLLTPRGLRTLDPADPGYKGRYRGRMFDRDAAYHNGTAWPWLSGAYVEAVLRAGEFSAEACAEARGVVGQMVGAIDESCPGSIAEVFDGDGGPDDPRAAGGCPAQAWSVAEALRGLALVIKAERGVKGL